MYLFFAGYAVLHIEGCVWILPDLNVTVVVSGSAFEPYWATQLCIKDGHGPRLCIDFPSVWHRCRELWGVDALQSKGLPPKSDHWAPIHARGCYCRPCRCYYIAGFVELLLSPKEAFTYSDLICTLKVLECTTEIMPQREAGQGVRYFPWPRFDLCIQEILLRKRAQQLHVETQNSKGTTPSTNDVSEPSTKVEMTSFLCSSRALKRC